MSERITHNVLIDSFYPLFQSRADKLRSVLETMGQEPLHALDFAILAGQDHIRELEATINRVLESYANGEVVGYGAIQQCKHVMGNGDE